MWGISSVVRAIDLHSIGHELESHILQTKYLNVNLIDSFLYNISNLLREKGFVL